MSSIQNLGRTSEEIMTEVNNMILCGGRYLNLEKSLGLGSSLVLGVDVAEDIWTKGLRKSGKFHDDVINHIRETNLPDCVAKFGWLRLKLVEDRLAALSANLRPLRFVNPALVPADAVLTPAIFPAWENTLASTDVMYDMVMGTFDMDFAAEEEYAHFQNTEPFV